MILQPTPKPSERLAGSSCPIPCLSTSWATKTHGEGRYRTQLIGGLGISEPSPERAKAAGRGSAFGDGDRRTICPCLSEDWKRCLREAGTGAPIPGTGVRCGRRSAPWRRHWPFCLQPSRADQGGPWQSEIPCPVWAILPYGPYGAGLVRPIRRPAFRGSPRQTGTARLPGDVEQACLASRHGDHRHDRSRSTCGRQGPEPCRMGRERQELTNPESAGQHLAGNWKRAAADRKKTSGRNGAIPEHAAIMP